MIPIQSFLWRIAFTLGALVLLASCGIGQSASTPPLPTEPPSTASPPPPTATLPPAQLTPATAPSRSPSPLSTAAVQAPTLTPTFPNPTQPARLTITLADDGKTIMLQVGDRFLLDLGPSYSWQVSVTDTRILRHVPDTGGKDNQGLYEALEPGSTTLTATGTPLCYNAVPRCLMPSRLFTLHTSVSGGANPGLTVTMASNGKTIALGVGQRFLLSLGPDFEWTVTVDDPNIVARVVNITVVKGAQGVYEAKKAGSTTLHATGIPVCPQGQMCPQIALAFQVQIVVK